MPRLLTVGEVISIVGFGRSQLYRKIAAGEFPAPLKVGLKSVRFREDDVHAWIDALPRRGGAVQ